MTAHIESFNQHGLDFWNPHGAYRTLHHINPARLQWIERYITLKNADILDIGCGGGILSESMAKKGARVTGIDLSESVLEAARLHRDAQGLSIDYQHISSQQLAEQAKRFDHITCLEMLEHVDNPASVLKDIYQLLKSGGYAFFSTLNRNSLSYLGAIVFAEKLTSLVPQGTHHYHAFIKPEELCAMVEHAGLKPKALCGLSYHPLLKTATLSRNLSINYLLLAQKP
ncbi:MAG: bifunctional 2-polyprenyl-6-hydroxyphenol methylase/3-demethylubiquinol 3-O-methyltransferase UbiG [Cardiobacteriaceae bacterium]|nr:bifunctional 2-polyprenyl-6-hydroxyphenol methylase/3-demethylubiquinol 3-O-methyltransferase UbiG [Cardiobacteriaceae bacterium]